MKPDRDLRELSDVSEPDLKSPSLVNTLSKELI